jgi:hypothetical protein
MTGRNDNTASQPAHSRGVWGGLSACSRPFRRLLGLGLLLLLVTTWGLLLAQKQQLVLPREFKEYPGYEYNNFPVPADYLDKHEWTRARLRYHSFVNVHGVPDGVNRWTVDYPRSDRHLLEGVRRLTRIDTKSVEQPVDLDGEDDVYNWPFMYAVEVGYWNLSDAEATPLREYLLRGGFFMCDDFHGTVEWENFMAGMKKVFPDRPVVDLDNKDPIFHVLYDLENRFQVPGMQYVVYPPHHLYEYDGYVPRWEGIYDDKGRVMVAICHNMDLGDAWENSDDPAYPERFASLAYRIAMNYFVYDLSH